MVIRDSHGRYKRRFSFRCSSRPKTQWLLDDAAHHIPEGGISVAEHHQLAELLDHVSSLVRERARSAVTIEGTVAWP